MTFTALDLIDYFNNRTITSGNITFSRNAITVTKGTYTNVTATFNAPLGSPIGWYYGNITAISANGGNETMFADLFVYGPPTADFIWRPLAPIVGGVVTFNASTTLPGGGSIVDYEWNFGDGQTASGLTAVHTYTNATIFTVTLNVTDSNGLWNTTQEQVQIAPRSVNTLWAPSRDSYSQINFISAWARGNCYGLSSTEILYFMHYILGNGTYPYLPAQDQPANWTSGLKLPTNYATLNNASLAVMFHQVYDPNNYYNPPSDESAEYNKLVGTLKSGVPALLTMHGKDGQGKDIYHAIVAYDIEMLPEGTVNIKVSDPNFPQQEQIANYDPLTQIFSYSGGYWFDKFEVITPQAVSISWWWYELTQSSWYLHNWLNFSVTGYNIVIADKNVTIKSNGLIDKFTQMGNSQTFVKAIPGTSGIEEGDVQVYAIPTGTPYTISNPASNQSTILITRVDNESGQLVGYGYLLNASTTQGSLNFTAMPSSLGLSISAGDNALNASVTFSNATLQGYSVSDVLTTQIDADQNVNLTALCLASFTASKNVVGKGYAIPVNVTITNVGNNPENVSITLYANSTTIGSETVFNVLNGTSVNVACIGNTSSCAYGDYTLSIYCKPSGVNEAANNFTYSGIVEVTIPGDVNGDFTVDIIDAIILAGSINSQPGSPRWNPNADLNGDGIIDIYDALILAGNYGKMV